MNLIDRAIAALAPRAGLQRAVARAKIDAVMNYDAASVGRRTYGWKAPGTDPDAASHAGRARLRQLSRDMIRNRAIASRAQSVVAHNVVGTGITASVRAEDKNIRERVEAIWNRHFNTTAIDSLREQNLAGLQAVVIRTVFSDGEVLVRRRMRNPAFEPDLVLPFQIELIEADHLNATITSHKGNEVIDGVEIGPTGRVVAYHLYREHPGSLKSWTKNKLVSERVPADSVLHIRRQDRPKQLRGVPWLAPVMMAIGELGDYQEAQILKQRVSSYMAAFVHSPDGGTKYDAATLTELAPGAVVGLDPGQEITFSDPPRVDGYGEFMKSNLAWIATGLDLTYEALSGDLSGTNFTSFRAGRMEMDRAVETWQQQLMIDQFCEGLARWVDEVWPMAQLPRGMAPVPVDAFTIKWTAPKRAMVDPNKEIPAIEKSIAAGLTSRQRAQRQMGLDPEQVRAERVEDAARDAAAGLVAATGQPGAVAPNEGNDA